MRIPAIEELMNHIPDARSKESMKEVLSCFYSGNLRSAVVMLYSTVVSDLYYKLCDLVSIYNDAGAKEIKDYVDNEWKVRPKIPNWETEMPKRCREKNKVLANDSYAHLCHLQDERNLCAHPVITANDLYRPSAATVQGFIVDMLVGVICKPSFLSKDLVDRFTDDIENASHIFPDKKSLQDYIKSKYLEKIDNEVEEYDLFRKLWKFVYKKTDDKSKANRDANQSILCLLYERNQHYFDQQIKKEETFYGESVALDDRACTKAFILFANEHLSLLEAMPMYFQLKLKQKVDSLAELKALAFCLSDDILLHAKSIDNSIGSCVAGYIFDYLSINVSRTEAINFAINLYVNSYSYNLADDYYDNMIDPILSEMTESQLVSLIDGSDRNCQIYNRRKFTSSRFRIKETLSKKNSNFDYSPYTNFNR